MDADSSSRTDARFLHSALTDRIIGCFYRVYNALGYGYLESVYERALLVALDNDGLIAESQVPLRVHYAGVVVGDFRADLVVAGSVIVEIKSAQRMDASFEAQLLNYLRCTELEVGLLLNFGPRPIVRRLVYDNTRKQLSVLSAAISGEHQSDD